MMLFAGAGSAGIDLGTLFPGVKGATAGNLAAWLIVDVAEPAPIIALAIDGGATNNTVRLEMDRNSSNEITSRGRAPDGGSQESTNGPLPTVGAYNHYLTGYNITGDLGFIYQNGVLDTSAAKAFAPATFDGTNHASGGLMSHADPSDSEHSQGRLEDARCYARLLSDNAIQTIHACRGHDGITDGLTCGRDLGSAVTDDYRGPFAFSGKLDYVTIDVSGELIEDHAAAMRNIMAHQ